MHLVVLCGADCSADQLGLTDQRMLRGVNLAWLRGTTKIPCLLKGISTGLCVHLEAVWASASGIDQLLLASVLGVISVVIAGTA